jgi:TonB family protein
VVHAVSASYIRSDHMSPVAALLAALLHVATALTLYLISPLNRQDAADEGSPPVTVTFEESKPAEPPAPAPAPPPSPPPPAAQAAPPPPPPPAVAAKPEPKSEAKPEPMPKPQQQATSKERPGVEPPAPIAAEPPKQQEAPKQEATLDPPKPADAKPIEAKPTETKAVESKPAEAKPAETKPADPAPAPQEAAAAPPAETPPPQSEPPLEKVVPPVETPAAPLSMRDFVKAMPQPPPPAPRPQPAPPQHPPQALQHSPLSTGQARPHDSSSASISTFTNPAASSASTRAKNAYLVGVLRKFSQYLPNLREKNEGGTVTLRFVVARDGRLVDASIVKSSGVTALDRGLLEALRAASPYGPMPAEIGESQVVFVQSIEAKR